MCRVIIFKCKICAVAKKKRLGNTAVERSWKHGTQTHTFFQAIPKFHISAHMVNFDPHKLWITFFKTILKRRTLKPEMWFDIKNCFRESRPSWQKKFIWSFPYPFHFIPHKVKVFFNFFFNSALPPLLYSENYQMLYASQKSPISYQNIMNLKTFHLLNRPNHLVNRPKH